MTHRIILPNTFKNEEHFIHVLVHDIMTRNGQEELLEGIVDVEYDQDHLQEIYVNVYDTLVWTILIWILTDDEENVYVEYSLHEGKKTFDDVM
jgi:hypothetical protein